MSSLLPTSTGWKPLDQAAPGGRQRQAEDRPGRPRVHPRASHQRKFGAPDEIIAQYHTFNPRGADLNALLADSATDVPTWNAAPSIIYHAIQMCSADGTYTAKERASVQRAAKTLGVPDDIVLTLHALVEMETATAQMRKALFHTHTI